MKAYIQLEQVKKTIDTFTIGPLNMTIEPGVVTALIGENGAGKSTILKMMMDLVRYDEGNLRRFSDDDNWKESVGYLAQTAMGYDGFTGSELKQLISKWYPSWDEGLFMEMVEQFQIILHEPYHKLSQGMQQRLHLSLTIPRNTKLLILDEPTSFLDIPAKHYLFDLLSAWMEQEDRSILLATHQADEVKKLADELILLKSGASLATVGKDQLIEQFRKYWFVDPVPFITLPGEVTRQQGEIVSYDSKATEAFLFENGLTPLKSSAMDLEEIMMILLQQDTINLSIFK